MMSSQHDLYIQGYTHATMGGTMGRETARSSQSLKPFVVRIAGCNSPA